MLTFENVTKSFELDEKNSVTPVKNVTFTIEHGDFIMIVGRSGTGKTTLLNLAAGLVKPTSGKIVFNTQNLGEMNDKQLSTLRTRSMGFVFQFPSMLSSLTILENINLPLIFRSNNGSKDTRNRATDLLEITGLSGKTNVYPKQLSAGEQKRVAIARSLINQPELILADEPTSDLDQQTEKEIMALFKDLNSKGISFLMVTHSLQLLPFATRAFEMENGDLKELANIKKA